MRGLVGTSMIGAILALGIGATMPASAETVVVKKVRGACYDSDGDRVPCQRSTYRSYRYSDPDYRYYRDPGVSVEFGVRDRRYRNWDRDWD
jgi:hypothetical protein